MANYFYNGVELPGANEINVSEKVLELSTSSTERLLDAIYQREEML